MESVFKDYCIFPIKFQIVYSNNNFRTGIQKKNLQKT